MQPTYLLRRESAWLAYLAAGVAVSAAYPQVEGAWAQAAVLVGLAASGAAALCAGVRLNRPRRLVPWLLLGAALVSWVTGWTLWEAHVIAAGAPPASGSIAHFVLLPSYVLIAGAFTVFLQRRDRGTGAFLDVAVVATALILVAYASLMYRYAEGSGSLLVRGVQIAFAALDVCMLAFVLRLLVTPGRRTPTLWLLVAGTSLLLASDGIWNWATLLAAYEPGSWADAGWLLLPVAVGTAALHPSMLRFDEERAEPASRFRWNRLVLLGVAAVVGPAVWALELARGRFDRHELLVLAGLTAVAELLVVARLAASLRRVERLSDEAKRAEAERERLLAQVRDHNTRLRELDRMKDDFVASVSHELRTPLTSIRGYVELLREGEAGELTAEQQSFLAVVDRNAQRLLRVVGDLLDVAQLEAGRLRLERECHDLTELVEGSVQAARPAADERGIELGLEAEALPPVEVDRGRLGQVIDNLLSNAVKFTTPGGRVDVRVFAPNGSAVVEVADTGLGIPEEEQAQLFERFFRAAAAGEHAIQGTGLGLWISKAIVDAHGGSIDVESRVGEGTTFRVELPLCAPVPVAEAAHGLDRR